MWVDSDTQTLYRRQEQSHIARTPDNYLETTEVGNARKNRYLASSAQRNISTGKNDS